METFFNASVLASTFRIATPLLLAALGCLLCDRAGIVNLAVEGFMLMGCFISIAIITKSDGSVWLGMLAALFGTTLYSAIYGVVVIKFKANQIVTSIAINMLSLGITSFLLQALLGAEGMIRPGNIKKMPIMKIEFLKDIPILNSIFYNQSFIVPLSIIIAVILFLVIKKTDFGLNVDSIKESSDAAKTAGISINKIKWEVILLSGAFCGVAGAYLSSVILSEFSQAMVQGRGFTAYTAVVFGASNPIFVWFVTLLFGWAEAVGVQIELSGVDIPPSIITMFPYLLAIVALIISSLSKKKNN